MILSRGRGVLLRDFVSSDLPTYLRWMRGDGAWKRMDAPWEQAPGWDDETQRSHETYFSGFLDPSDVPRRRAAIEVGGGLIGWVNRYQDGEHADACMIGIDICEDEMLGRRLGSEALHLWVNYLFSSGAFHRIGLATYSFNEAMLRLAGKLGFREEGRQREIHYWGGEWVDRLFYGLLISEWNSR
jgi:RimJ/RimL family protein N-acetyltransferase